MKKPQKIYLRNTCIAFSRCLDACILQLVIMAKRGNSRAAGKKPASFRTYERSKKILARRSSSAAVSRDLPMPASPESNTIWPSPVFAVDQRRSSNSSSSCRPTTSVRPLACSASKRPSAELVRSAAQARAGPAMPLRSFAPRSSSSNRLPSEFAGTFGNDDTVWLRNALQARSKVRRLAYDGCSCD